ncbi:MAG: hypothetical protein ABIZ04_22660 [Opitutus sp.]
MASRRWWVVAVFVTVAAAQLWLVAVAGTDIPYQDQWDSEGAVLYPKWQDGSLSLADIFLPHNEHRIVWTKLLDLVLFIINGQWDPLVQLVAGALLKGAVAAAILAGLLSDPAEKSFRVVTTILVTFAFLPLLGWNNALWGFQSQVYFSVLFSVLALWMLLPESATGVQRILGLALGIAAQLAMSAGVFVPVAVLGVTALRVAERRRFSRNDVVAAFPAGLLLILALATHVTVDDHAGLHARSMANFFAVLLSIAAWPHETERWAAFAMNAPLMIAIGGRLLRWRREFGPSEHFALALAFWALAGAGAVAWFRGGGAEFLFGVPSRYVDFFVLLPIANAWCLVILVREVSASRTTLTRWCAGGWFAFAVLGWAGLSAQVMRGLVLPRIRDRDAPVRLAVAFQKSNDPRVFDGQWRVLVPHPRPEVVGRVLNDPRMKGVLPPSLQPTQPIGPLSRAVRWLLGRGSVASSG